MQNTNSLILASFALLTLVVGLFGVAIYRSQANTVASIELEQPQHVTQRPAISVGSSRALSQKLRLDINRQRERIQELQMLLSEREAVLARQSSQLKLRTRESEELKTEADRYFMMLMELLNESAASLDENLSTLDSVESAETASSDFESTEAPELRSEQQLSAALATAEWELEQLRLSDEESKTLLAQETTRNTSLREAISNSGVMAVPFLVHTLAEEDVELRVWAATTLGQVGVDSQVAMEALLVAIDDEDQQVQAAATSAIEAINSSN